MSVKPVTIPEAFFSRTKISGSAEALRYKRDGYWISVSWTEYENHVRTLAASVAAWIDPGDNVCILSENRPEWCYADLAILALAGVSSPIYATSPPKDIAYILNDSESKLLFVSNEDQLEKIRNLKNANRIPQLCRVIVFDAAVNAHVQDEDWVIRLPNLLKDNQSANDPIPERMRDIDAEKLATLIYTSGTTGEPKGVMLTHNNIMSNVYGASVIVDAVDMPVKLMLSFLPLAHAFERTAGYYVAIHYGFTVAFAENLEKLADNIMEVRPTVLVSVPRVYEKLYGRVVETATKRSKRYILGAAIWVGKRYADSQRDHTPPPWYIEFGHSLAKKIVFSKIHERLGGRLQYAISGGAPLSKKIGTFLSAIGFTICEGYGLSETAPVLTANRPKQIKIGSVGLPFPGVEIKIQPEPDRNHDGEILARGPGIMKGYFKKPEETAAVIDSDGWFHTGDIGYVDDDGFLFITDRKKELIKTSGGKYVAPQPIENRLKIHPLIEQAVVIGDRRPYCVAMIVPKYEALQKKIGRPLPDDRRKINKDLAIRQIYDKAIEEVNVDLGRWEQIKKYILLSRELTIEEDEITPTLKIKRRVIENHFKKLIHKLYS